MVLWSKLKRRKVGKYIVCSDDETGHLRVDIVYWDGSKWSGLDKRNKPIKWSWICR